MTKLAVPIRCRELMSELSRRPRTSKIPVPHRLMHALNAVVAIRPPNTPITAGLLTTIEPATKRNRGVIERDRHRASKFSEVDVKSGAELKETLEVCTKIAKTSPKFVIAEGRRRIHGQED